MIWLILKKTSFFFNHSAISSPVVIKYSFDKYQKSDKAAIRHQKYHKRLTIIAAVCGTIAVLFAIVQLSGFFLSPWHMGVEVLAALITFVAVILGLEQAPAPPVDS